MSLKNIKILLGVSGGIAAYKTPDLVRKLTSKGAEVRVVLTQSAQHFVSPLSLQAVSGNAVHHDLLDTQAEAAMGHIALAKWADVLVVAPATANCMAKFAHGLADDLLTTLYLATSAKIILAPAMNQQMWAAPATQNNLALLRAQGVTFFGPDSGEQACGDVGAGRMTEPMDIADQLESLFRLNRQDCDATPLAGKRVVITAGPTREALDPIRYLTNHSSGKMGYAIAEAAYHAGATVTLVTGPVDLNPPLNVERINVQSAEQMHSAVMANIENCDIFIATAAVADYKAEQVATQKIKKDEAKLTLTFIKNPDILKDVANLERSPFTLGFAAETQHLEEYANKKLINKKLDMIAANDVSAADIGFNSDKNALTILWQGGKHTLPKADKKSLAVNLIDVLATQYNKKYLHGAD
jgi:phosphopantothenoylcysteine decarboxylase/phosphopantothenate--cysteine ligase